MSIGDMLAKSNTGKWIITSLKFISSKVNLIDEILRTNKEMQKEISDLNLHMADMSVELNEIKKELRKK